MSSSQRGPHRRLRLAALTGLLAAATTAALASPLDADPAAPGGAGTAPAASGLPRAAVQGYRIDEWKALSNESLIIRTNDGKRYHATLMGRCIGLKAAETIAFVTRGERTVDRFAGIMLPDGSRCYFKTFEAISQPSDSRESSRP
jgi:hypothetical protein